LDFWLEKKPSVVKKLIVTQVKLKMNLLNFKSVKRNLKDDFFADLGQILHM
jgi:hypothetical protein